MGEDGPTHQPVETISGLRVIPNLDVIRPADPEETAGAWMAAMQRADGPTALILTRQKVATLNGIPVETRREGVLKGAYIARKEQGALKAIILASGSELELALKAAENREGPGRSTPSFCRFDAQPAEYREACFPPHESPVAGVTDLWWKYLAQGSGASTVSARSRNTGSGRTRHECGQRRCRRPQGFGQINREYFPSSPFRGCSASAGTAPFSCLPGCQEKGKAVFTKHQYP
ncbi:MAG: transketolase-like TK C-terminal-containing protein [Akkermansia muciniphila]